MAELPLAPLKRIFKKVGAERVSDDTVEILSEHLESQAEIIAQNTLNMATHAGRKTLQSGDIELAIKTLYE